MVLPEWAKYSALGTYLAWTLETAYAVVTRGIGFIGPGVPPPLPGVALSSYLTLTLERDALTP